MRKQTAKPQSKLAKARLVCNKYRSLLSDLRLKARDGDSNASLEIIRQMTAFEKALTKLGFRTTDESDYPKPLGRLVRRTNAWIRKDREQNIKWLQETLKRFENIPSAKNAVLKDWRAELRQKLKEAALD